jgi:mono/diheme cytochrome c family protein
MVGSLEGRGLRMVKEGRPERARRQGVAFRRWTNLGAPEMLKGLVLGIVLTVLAAAGTWLAVAYGGLYNVAATDPHADAVRWTLDTTMQRSVARRAGTARVPVSVPEGVLEEGARLYAGDCVQCHGGPGAEPAGWSRGMRPEPPHLVEAATEWSPEEVHWIVENGIKMSGMPAFGTERTPEELVAIAVFVRDLPGLSAADYTAMTGGTE